jgi:hypothetical protein
MLLPAGSDSEGCEDPAPCNENPTADGCTPPPELNEDVEEDEEGTVGLKEEEIVDEEEDVRSSRLRRLQQK